jgi:hypothetical protein
MHSNHSLWCTIGICRKVKVEFFLKGHSHNSDDGEIGTCGKHIANENLPTYERFEEEIKNAFTKKKAANVFVER